MGEYDHPWRRQDRLGAAIQLGFVRMTGNTLDAFDSVPRTVLEQIARQLNVPAPELTTLRALYRRRPTLFAHQAWACEYAGFRWPESTDITAVLEALVAGSSVTLDRNRLARQAREELFVRRRLIPSDREIDEWIRRAIHLVEVEDRRYLDAATTAALRESWLPRLLAERSPGPITLLEWLRRPPRKRSTKTLEEEAAKFHAIRALAPLAEIPGIPPERLRAYARRMRRRRPIKVRQITEPRRTLEIAALLRVLAARQSDTVLRLIEMRIAEIWRWAQALVHPERPALLPADIAQQLARAMDDPQLSDQAFREWARGLLAPWKPGARSTRRTRAAQVRERLAADHRRIRPLLKTLIPLRLQGQPDNPVIAALRELELCYREQWFDLYEWARSPIGHAWNELIQTWDRHQAFRAFEAATLWAVRRGLRNGSLWLPHAEHYGGQHRLLLGERRWGALRSAFLDRRSLPSAAEPYLERVLAQVKAGLQAVEHAAGTGDVRIEDGRVLLRDDPAVSIERGDADLLREQLYARVGRAQLPDLLLAVDGETHFSWELLGRRPSSPELVPLYAAILVAALALDSTECRDDDPWRTPLGDPSRLTPAGGRTPPASSERYGGRVLARSAALAAVGSWF